MSNGWFWAAGALCLLVMVAQCSIASDCRKDGGTPVRGYSKAVECIKPAGKPEGVTA
jgi:hypothetical protein